MEFSQAEMEQIVGRLYLVILGKEKQIADLEKVLPKEATPKPTLMTLVSTPEGPA